MSASWLRDIANVPLKSIKYWNNKWTVYPNVHWIIQHYLFGFEKVDFFMIIDLLNPMFLLISMIKWTFKTLCHFIEKNNHSIIRSQSIQYLFTIPPTLCIAFFCFSQTIIKNGKRMNLVGFLANWRKRFLEVSKIESNPTRVFFFKASYTYTHTQTHTPRAQTTTKISFLNRQQFWKRWRRR